MLAACRILGGSHDCVEILTATSAMRNPGVMVKHAGARSETKRWPAAAGVLPGEPEKRLGRRLRGRFLYSNPLPSHPLGPSRIGTAARRKGFIFLKVSTSFAWGLRLSRPGRVTSYSRRVMFRTPTKTSALRHRGI